MGKMENLLLKNAKYTFIFSRTLFFTHLHFVASQRHKLGLEDLDRDSARTKRHCSSKTLMYRSNPNPSLPYSFRPFIAPALAPKKHLKHFNKQALSYPGKALSLRPL